MIRNSKISIVIPCYNEEGNIVVLFEKLKSILSEELFEIVFVDDNSKDNTLSIIQKIALSDNRVKYLSFSRNFGHQNALRAGLEYAEGDCVISMDADLQHPPELLPELILKWRDGFEIVITLRKDTVNIPFYKKITAHYFYRIINYLSDINIQQGSADFRLLDRKVVDVLVYEISEYHLFYRGLVSWLGFNQCSVEYIPNKRFSGTSKYTFRKMLSFAVDGITSFSIKPLKVATFIGFIFSILSALYGFYALYMALFTSQTIKGWSSVLMSVVFIGGINLIVLGIIGEYIGKIYFEIKGRPKYIVSKSNIENRR